MLKSDCEHFVSQVGELPSPRADRCETCGLLGPLRMCATCGYVGCCESMNSHDTQHWQETGHSVIVRLPLSDASWFWCYEHTDYLRDS